MLNIAKVLFLSPLLVFFTGFLLSQCGLPPGWALGVGVLAVAALWGVGIYRAIEQGRQIERLRVAAERARQEAEERQAIADRLAEEEYAAWQEAHRARVRMEARAAMRGFINPN